MLPIAAFRPKLEVRLTGPAVGPGRLAATAVQRRLTLLTHDRDFAGRTVTGLIVLSFA